MAMSYNNLGCFLSELGENDKARECCERSLSIGLKLFGEEHADVANSRDSLGDVLVALELHDEAEQQYLLAAEAGNAGSMLSLGRRWVRADEDAELEQGATWLQRAAEAGNEEAAGLLEGLEELDPLAQANAVRERLEAESEGSGEEA